MAECRGCGTPQGSDNQFCPQCGTPQTEAAADRFEQYVQKQVQQRMGAAGGGQSSSNGQSSQPNRRQSQNRGQQADTNGEGGTKSLLDRLDDTAIDRISYGAGAIVAIIGFSQLLLAGIPLILAGIAMLPPTRELLGRPLGAPIARVPMIGMAAVLVLIGGVLWYL